MKVIVVEEIEYSAYSETFSMRVGTATIAMTEKMYHPLTKILGVYVLTDTARKAIENRKKELIKEYGEKALDDENTKDKHTFYTFASRVLELNDNKEEVYKDE